MHGGIGSGSTDVPDDRALRTQMSLTTAPHEHNERGCFRVNQALECGRSSERLRERAACEIKCACTTCDCMCLRHVLQQGRDGNRPQAGCVPSEKGAILNREHILSHGWLPHHTHREGGNLCCCHKQEDHPSYQVVQHSPSDEECDHHPYSTDLKSRFESRFEHTHRGFKHCVRRLHGPNSATVQTNSADLQ
jgi:hypothetical protein